MSDNTVASRDYFEFYMEGIHERRPRELRAIDPDAIAARVLASSPSPRSVFRDAIRDAIRTDCTTAVKSLMEGRSRTRWMNDHRGTDLDGGALDDAYEAYCDGRVDSMVLTLEERTLAALEAHLRGMV